MTVRKIKQTYQEKKQFWDNVIKMNVNVSDIELKKDFYIQKRNAEEREFDATDHQKDKHKPYHVLMGKLQKNQQLRDYQQTNKIFEEKVVRATNTLQQWQNITQQPKISPSQPPHYSSVEPTVINKFMGRPKNTSEEKNARREN